ncbi:MAG: ester cyclase [Pseudomonadota bacterium]
MEFQREKTLVRAYHAALYSADWCAADQHVSPGRLRRGNHPFKEITGPEEVSERFWKPLHTSLTHLQRREDVFFAGRNEVDGFASTWVVSMGHLVGLFDAPWLGIPPTGRLAFLRYCSFLRVEDGRITYIAMYFDIPHLMVQAGLAPFHPSTGAQLVQPGPMTHDGILSGAHAVEQGERTLALINAMVADLGTWNSDLPIEEELARTWADDMVWWGPTGIGATYTIPRYAKQHAGPFRAAFSERTKTQHIARLAEGHYGGFFGWPNFQARLTGPFQGHEPTGKIGEFRVIDIYRRAGDKLAENWVFIDMPHFWLSQGVAVLPEEAMAV